MSGSDVRQPVTTATVETGDRLRLLAENLASADALFHRAARGAEELDARIGQASRTVGALADQFGRTIGLVGEALSGLRLDQAAVGVTRLEGSFAGIVDRAPLGASAISTFGSAVESTRFQTESGRRSAEDYATSLGLLVGAGVDQDEATLRAQRGMLTLNQTLADNEGQWRTTTEAGLANREALVGQIRLYDDLRRANIRAGMSAEEANQRFASQVRGLANLARAAGAGRQVLDDLAGTYDVNVRVNTFTGAIAKAASVVSGVLGRFGFADGGVTPTGTPFWVGENGPELMTGTAPGFVMSHPQSVAFADAAIASARGGGAGTAGGDRSPVVQLQFSSDGGDLGNLLVQLISKTVRVKGGNAAVLGIRS